MFDVKTPNNLANELETLFNFGDETGFRIYHNSFGMGATIPEHEHYHLLNFSPFTNGLGEEFGFDGARDFLEIVLGVKKMAGFPFAHAIFEQKDPAKIEYFIRKLNEAHGRNYEFGRVPNSLAQGQNGILIVPAKKFMKKGRGAGDVAGRWYCVDEDALEKATFSSAFEELGEILFKEDEMNVKSLL